MQLQGNNPDGERPLPQFDIGSYLASLMEAHNIKATEIAELCNVKVPSVYGWIATGRIAKHHLPKLADHFGVSLSSFYGTDLDDEPTMTDDKRKMLLTYRVLRQSGKEKALADILWLAEQEKEKSAAGRPSSKPTPKKKN